MPISGRGELVVDFLLTLKRVVGQAMKVLAKQDWGSCVLNIPIFPRED